MSTNLRRMLNHMVPALTVVALGAPAAHAQQTLTLTLDAAPQTFISSHDNISLNVTGANSGTLLLTAGTPQTIDLGMLDTSADSSLPNNSTVTFDFSFTRPLTVTLPGQTGPFAFTETISGSETQTRGGTAGQYLERGLTFNGDFAPETYSLGSVGNLGVQLQPAIGLDTGLSSSLPLALSAVLTFTPAPEPSQLMGLALGALGLAGLGWKAKRRTA